MANPNYKSLSVKREIFEKLQALSNQRGMPISQVIDSLLESANANIVNQTNHQSQPSMESEARAALKRQITAPQPFGSQNNAAAENDVVGNAEETCVYLKGCPLKKPENMQQLISFLQELRAEKSK